MSELKPKIYMYFLKPKKGADPLTQIFNLPQKMSDPPPQSCKLEVSLWDYNFYWDYNVYENAMHLNAFNYKWYMYMYVITAMDYLTMYKYYRRILCFSTGTWLCYHNRAIRTGARVAQSAVKQHQFKKRYKIELVDSVIHYCAIVMPKTILPNP